MQHGASRIEIDGHKSACGVRPAALRKAGGGSTKCHLTAPRGLLSGGGAGAASACGGPHLCFLNCAFLNHTLCALRPFFFFLFFSPRPVILRSNHGLLRERAAPAAARASHLQYKVNGATLAQAPTHVARHTQ